MEGSAVLIVSKPSGPISNVLTVTGTSTAGFKITVHVTATSAPIGRMGLTGLLVTLTEVGAGTIEHDNVDLLDKHHGPVD